MIKVSDAVKQALLKNIEDLGGCTDAESKNYREFLTLLSDGRITAAHGKMLKGAKSRINKMTMMSHVITSSLAGQGLLAFFRESTLPRNILYNIMETLDIKRACDALLSINDSMWEDSYSFVEVFTERAMKLTNIDDKTREDVCVMASEMQNNWNATSLLINLKIVDKNSLLMFASTQNNAWMVRKIIASGINQADVNKALVYAVERCDKEIVEILLGDGNADPFAMNYSAFWNTTYNKNKNNLELLLKSAVLKPKKSLLEFVKMVIKNVHRIPIEFIESYINMIKSVKPSNTVVKQTIKSFIDELEKYMVQRKKSFQE